MPRLQLPARLPVIAAAAAVAVVAGSVLTSAPTEASAVEGSTQVSLSAPTATPIATVALSSAAPSTAAVTPAAPATAAAAAAAPSKLTWTYAGDSLTEMPKSWMRQLKDTTMTNVGGTAIGNATTTRILDDAEAHDADVLVVMAGTNDLRYQRSSASILQNIDKIATKVGADHVVISAIAPSNATNSGKSHVDRRKLGEVLNRDLQNHALTRGWMFVDPWAADRRLDGGWPSSRTYDGVHPTVAMSKKVSVRMQQAIHIAAEGAKGAAG
ncbi:SGNH/GDSL hydrolase family protein [Curtobacterium aurantiacum]|uniref:SGNH/GDSL hydrolase family protein n=1 Tax=Curtobacterium aurantiacum TaxID=3236919 RepID=UPI001BE09AD1|nr:SGNH/GDSL hydrolase family protein [Curtobacterium flaccumfaciens]MBT1675188.1 hypothetical protein [Curtobacterium flaccumfaciens pv. flaccumfaciens]